MDTKRVKMYYRSVIFMNIVTNQKYLGFEKPKTMEVSRRAAESRPVSVGLRFRAGGLPLTFLCIFHRNFAIKRIRFATPTAICPGDEP